MTIDLWKCDVCGNEFRVGHGSTVIFHVGNESDPVDSHNMRIYKDADLCTRCQTVLLEKMINEIPIEGRAQLAKECNAR
jgi:hypothetical protein